MRVKLAETDEEIEQCFPVMVQLRSNLTPSTFVERVKHQWERDGYRLVYVEDANAVRAVAGFRIEGMLSRGRFLYVDDLVTDLSHRSKGYGSILLDWLVGYAKSQNCDCLELDSGVQRGEAHRFYFRKGMQISAYHFSLEIGGEPPA